MPSNMTTTDASPAASPSKVLAKKNTTDKVVKKSGRKSRYPSPRALTAAEQAIEAARLQEIEEALALTPAQQAMVDGNAYHQEIARITSQDTVTPAEQEEDDRVAVEKERPVRDLVADPETFEAKMREWAKAEAAIGEAKGLMVEAGKQLRALHEQTEAFAKKLRRYPQLAAMPDGTSDDAGPRSPAAKKEYSAVAPPAGPKSQTSTTLPSSSAKQPESASGPLKEYPAVAPSAPVTTTTTSDKPAAGKKRARSPSTSELAPAAKKSKTAPAVSSPAPASSDAMKARDTGTTSSKTQKPQPAKKARQNVPAETSTAVKATEVKKGSKAAPAPAAAAPAPAPAVTGTKKSTVVDPMVATVNGVPVKRAAFFDAVCGYPASAKAARDKPKADKKKDAPTAGAVTKTTTSTTTTTKTSTPAPKAASKESIAKPAYQGTARPSAPVHKAVTKEPSDKPAYQGTARPSAATLARWAAKRQAASTKETTDKPAYQGTARRPTGPRLSVYADPQPAAVKRKLDQSRMSDNVPIPRPDGAKKLATPKGKSSTADVTKPKDKKPEGEDTAADEEAPKPKRRRLITYAEKQALDKAKAEAAEAEMDELERAEAHLARVAAANRPARAPKPAAPRRVIGSRGPTPPPTRTTRSESQAMAAANPPAPKEPVVAPRRVLEPWMDEDESDDGFVPPPLWSEGAMVRKPGAKKGVKRAVKKDVAVE